MKEFKENFFCKTLEKDENGVSPRVYTLSYLAMVTLDNDDSDRENPFSENMTLHDGYANASTVTMGLKVEQEFIELDLHQVTSQASAEQIHDLKETFNIDLKDQMSPVLYNEMEQMEYKEIINLLLEKAEEMVFYDQPNKNRVKAFVNRIFGYKPRFSIGVNSPEDSRKVFSKMLMLSNLIATKCRRGPANFILAPFEVIAMLKDMSAFTFAPFENTVMQNIPIAVYEGNIAGLNVYGSYLVPKNTVVVGRGTNSGDEPNIYQIDNEAILNDYISPMSMNNNFVLFKYRKTGILPEGELNYAKFQFNTSKISFWKDLWCRIGFGKCPKDYII